LLLIEMNLMSDRDELASDRDELNV
jgi:hypothetical protein